MLTNLFLESTEHTIPSIVITLFLILNISESSPSQVTLCFALISVSVLNLHEDERQKPEHWIPIGRMPCFDDDKAKTLRPGQGYETCNARKLSCFMIVFATSCFMVMMTHAILKTLSGGLKNGAIDGGLAGKQIDGGLAGKHKNFVPFEKNLKTSN